MCPAYDFVGGFVSVTGHVIFFWSLARAKLQALNWETCSSLYEQPCRTLCPTFQEADNAGFLVNNFLMMYFPEIARVNY